VLTQIELRNFKSYRSATLKLGRLTVLIGANASGKSNLIEALRFLATLAKGERLSTLGTSSRPDHAIFRGGFATLGYRGAKTIGLSCVTTEPDWNQLSIDLNLRDDHSFHVTQEKITSPTSSVPLYEITSPPQGTGSDVFVTYNNFARGGKKPRIVCSSHMAIFTQLLSAIRFRSENVKSREVIPAIAEQYVQWLSNIVFLNPEPSLMRSYGHKTDHRLNEHGENLSGVLYTLCSKPEIKPFILGFIQSLPEQDIEDIGFIETPREEVLLQLTETFGGTSTPCDASILSDGTLRVLSIGAAMLSAPEQSLVVIEEIDNGVHPSRTFNLLQQISTIADHRNLRVLISSHNPALLNALPDESVPDIVFCYRNPQDGASQLVRLQDIPDYPELIAQGSVGHLMTYGLLERFVKQHPGRDQKRKMAMEWLASLATVGDHSA
jgi:predicted ATPase